MFFLTSYAATTHKDTVYIYNDDGVSQESLAQTIHTFKTILPSTFKIKKINAAQLIQNYWEAHAALFIMPGGADLAYVKKLNGAGNQRIKNYVAQGGTYLGFCAGAYYGSAEVEFDKNGALEVIGNRELAFFPGKAIGPVLAPYHYQNNAGARVAKITLPKNNLKKITAYYNGGGYFEKAETMPHVSIIGYYQNHLPAIISINYGLGHVILSGVHFEYDTTLFPPDDPYLKKLIPALKNSKAKRQLFIKQLFIHLF